jgi:hypothetical protein
MNQVVSINSIVHKLMSNKRRQALEAQRSAKYEDMVVIMRTASVTFRPQSAKFTRNLTNDLKIWGVWKDMRDVLVELDKIQESLSEVHGIKSKKTK